jgi:hypothetical protein
MKHVRSAEWYEAEIARLNARIEKMDAERIEMIARTNDELDRLRDAIARRGLEQYWP